MMSQQAERHDKRDSNGTKDMLRSAEKICVLVFCEATFGVKTTLLKGHPPEIYNFNL